jgi:VWFA-related protein
MRCWPYFFLIAAVAAQTPTAEVTAREEPVTFHTGVTLVRVPVVVRDKQGHPVGGLHKDDFHLTDLGKPQEIAQFALGGGASEKPAEMQAAPVAPMGEPAVAGAKPSVPTRFVAFVFDDVHLDAGELGSVRAAVLKHLEHGIPPHERIALLTLSGTLSLPLTDDLAKFRETLAKIQPVAPRVHFPPANFYAASQYMRNPGDESLTCACTTAFNVECDPRMPRVLQTQSRVSFDCLHLTCGYVAEAAPIARSTLRAIYNEGDGETQNTFHILNNIVRLLGSMPGDRIMLLMSPGIYLPDDLQRSLSDSIDRATRSGVIINTVDARGVYPVDPGGEVAGCVLTQVSTQQEVAAIRHEAVSAQGLILDNLAYSTGGTAATDNDFAGSINRLASPPDYVYYLGFYPSGLKPDGKFHEIKVTLSNGQGLTVQARKGYWAPAHLEDPGTATARDIADAVFSADAINDLPLDIDTEFYKETSGDAKLKITAHLDIRQLRLHKAEGSNRDDLTVVCALFDANGNYLKGVQKAVELRVKDENVEHRRSLGITVRSDFEVQRGAYMIRVVARDAAGQQMAAANDSVEIP